MVQIDKGGIEVPIGISYSYATHADRIITLFHNDPARLKSAFPKLPDTGWKSNGYIKELATTTWIKSLAERPFPEITDEDTRIQKLTKTLDMEWSNDTPRFHLALWITNKANPSAYPVDWMFKGMHSLISAAGLPWRQYETFNALTRNIARSLGEGSRLGVSLIDVGFGYPRENDPTGKNDIITIEGTATQEFVCVSDDPQPVVIYVGSTTSASPSPSPSPSPTPTVTPPTIALTLQSGTSQPFYTYDFDFYSPKFDVSGLTASATFTIQWVKNGTLIGTATTYTASSTGTYSLTATLSSFANAPFNGSGDYKIRVTQNSVSTDSPTLTINHPTATISPTSYPIDGAGSVRVTVYGIKLNQTFTLSWQKDLTDVSGSNSNRTMSVASGTPFDFAASMFASSPYTGVGNYRAKIVVGSQTIYSSAIAITAATGGGGGFSG